MNKNKNVASRTVKSRRNPCPEDAKIPCSPRLITLDLCTVRRAINKVAGTLCNPDYQEKMATYTKDSLSNSVDTLQKLTQISCRLSCLDRKGWDCLINCSIDELMSKNLEINQKLIGILQEQSSTTIEILEKNLDKCQMEEEEKEEE